MVRLTRQGRIVSAFAAAVLLALAVVAWAAPSRRPSRARRRGPGSSTRRPFGAPGREAFRGRDRGPDGEADRASRPTDASLAVRETAAREALSRLAALLRSGASPGQSLRVVAATSEDPDWVRAARRVATRLDTGPDPEAGDEAGERAEAELLWMLSVSARSGAPPAGLVERLADDAASRADAARSRTAGQAAARSTRKILAWLPLGGIALAQLLGADPLRVLFLEVGGRIALLLGVFFWLAAMLWSRAILRSVMRPARPARPARAPTARGGGEKPPGRGLRGTGRAP